MNDLRQDNVLRSVDRTIELFSQLRTPDAASTAAFDTLKQARALIARALAAEERHCSSAAHQREAFRCAA